MFVCIQKIRIFVLSDGYTGAPRHNQSKLCFCARLPRIFVTPDSRGVQGVRQRFNRTL